MPRLTVITARPKAHHSDETEEHEKCISNLLDVTSLEITCNDPDLFI